MRLLKQDNERHAMLLEHLGPSLGVLGLSIENQMRILCDTLGEAWKIPAPLGLNTGAEKARWLRQFITEFWEELGAPCSARVIQQAINFAESRIAEFTPETSVLVHGDAHGANILSDPTHPGRFKLIDPDGLLAEPACDLAVPMREWSRELLSGDAFERGRERCGFLS